MPYEFAQQREDYSDFATGRVFESLPGRTAFPVRLAREIFARCHALQVAAGAPGPYTLYDPCCGSAYLLCTLAYGHWDALAGLIGSDVDPDALGLAARNLALLTLPGLDARIARLTALHALYGKESHAAALASAARLRARLQTLTGRHPLPAHLFAADALNGTDIRAGLVGRLVDLVITDVPYGHSSAWEIAGAAHAPEAGPTGRLLDSLRPVLAPTALVAIVTDKAQKVSHAGYARVAHFQLGKRRVVFLRPRPAP